MYQVTQTYDQVWASFPVWVSAAVELYVGIVSLSTLHLPPLPKILDSNTSQIDMHLYPRHKGLLRNLHSQNL